MEREIEFSSSLISCFNLNFIHLLSFPPQNIFVYKFNILSIFNLFFIYSEYLTVK